MNKGLASIINPDLTVKERAGKAVKKYVEAVAELEALAKAYADKGITVEKLIEIADKQAVMKERHIKKCLVAFLGKKNEAPVNLADEFAFIED